MTLPASISFDSDQHSLIYSRVQTTKTAEINKHIDNAIQGGTSVLYLSALPYNEIVRKSNSSLIQYNNDFDNIEDRKDILTYLIKDMAQDQFDTIIKAKPSHSKQNRNPAVIVGKVHIHDLTKIESHLAYAKSNDHHPNFAVFIDEADMLVLNEDEEDNSEKAKNLRTQAEKKILRIISQASGVIYVTGTPVGTLFQEGKFRVDHVEKLNYQKSLRDGYLYFDALNEAGNGYLTHIKQEFPTKSNGRYNLEKDSYGVDLAVELQSTNESMLLITNSRTISQHDKTRKAICNKIPTIPVIVHNNDSPSCYIGNELSQMVHPH